MELSARDFEPDELDQLYRQNVKAVAARNAHVNAARELHTDEDGRLARYRETGDSSYKRAANPLHTTAERLYVQWGEEHARLRTLCLAAAARLGIAYVNPIYVFLDSYAPGDTGPDPFPLEIDLEPVRRAIEGPTDDE